MTELEWRHAVEPQKMLKHLTGSAGERKLRLFAAACCRSIWYIIPKTPHQAALSVGERYADGIVDEQALEAAVKDVPKVHIGDNAEADPYHLDCWRCDAVRSAIAPGKFGTASAGSVCELASQAAAMVASYAAGLNSLSDIARRREQQRQAALLREIFANPFRPAAPNPNWLDDEGIALANAIYDERQFDRLPELAAKLEAAGCDRPEILAHFKNDRGHVSGCWALDLVRGVE
ncbi:MAG TPA: hypothetical protein VG269_24575 [Tepidisphaeraceae bacterium]|jgi:hypothetical protein|nr:hypothetical protein [Tepidisphaeraceae bacterium]